MFRITEDPSSGSLVQCLAKNCKNCSIVSVDMDKVGVMAAYCDKLCVCVVHCIWRHSVLILCIGWIIKCLIIIDTRCKHEDIFMVCYNSVDQLCKVGNLGIPQMFKNFPPSPYYFIDPDGSLPHWQESVTFPHSEPCQPSPIWLWSILILSSHLRLVLPSCYFPSGFPTKTMYEPLSHTCYMLGLSDSSWYDRQGNDSWGVRTIQLLVTFLLLLQSPVTFSLLGPNILLCALFSKSPAYVRPSFWQTKFHTHTKQQEKLWLFVF